MKPTTIIVPLACLSLALQADAFGFGSFIRTIKLVVDGVSKLADLTSGRFTDAQMGFQEDEDFKAYLVGVTAFCQMKTPEGRMDANAMCADFGQRYFPKAAGEWGCANVKGDGDESDDQTLCRFQPARHFVPEGRELVFGRSGRPAFTRANPFFDEEENDIAPIEDDEIAPAFPDNDHFYARELTADLRKYTLAYEGTQGDSDDSEADSAAIVTVSAMMSALEIAGIRYPVGKRMCQLCKGTCNRIVPAGSRDTCKYTVCVKRLGGYQGTHTKPSCADVRRP